MGHRKNFNFILPAKMKKDYISQLAKNGTIDDLLWNRVENYIRKRYRSVDNIEEYFSNLFYCLDNEVKKDFLNLIRKENKELFKKLSKKIYSLEDITSLNKEKVKQILKKYNQKKLLKATLAISPSTLAFIKELSILDFDIISEQTKIKPIKIETIQKIHRDIIDIINGSM